MKVRIGYGLGTRASSDPDRFAALVTGLERLRFDSLWLSERVTGDCPDPDRRVWRWRPGWTTKIKFGFSVLVLPGRNPMLLAKELATLDRLSHGRLLPAFGLGAVDPGEHQAFGVERGDRAAHVQRGAPAPAPLLGWRDRRPRRSLPPLRGRGRAADAVQEPLEIWLGGIAPSELSAALASATAGFPRSAPGRCARTASSRSRSIAAEADRAIDPEHFGALIPYTDGPIPDIVAAGIAKRRPGVDPTEVIAVRARRPARDDRAPRRRRRLEVRRHPARGADRLGQHLAEVADTLLPLQA